jgi:uncharacterized protein involved in exopolysaccharide biosynthesis
LDNIKKIFCRDSRNILFFSIIFFVFGYIYSSFFPDIYESKASILPIRDSYVNALNINLLDSNDITITNKFYVDQKVVNRDLIISTLNSREFIYDVIIKYGIYFSSSTYSIWNKKNNEINGSNNNLKEAYESFKDNVKVVRSRDNSLVSIHVSHTSPQLSKKWLEFILEDFSSYLILKEKPKILNHINYLKNKINEDDGFRSLYLKLLEEEERKLMLSSTESGYIFSVVDKPLLSEGKVLPKRELIYFLFTFLGSIFGIVWNILSKSKSKSKLIN